MPTDSQDSSCIEPTDSLDSSQEEVPSNEALESTQDSYTDMEGEDSQLEEAQCLNGGEKVEKKKEGKGYCAIM